MIAGRYLAEQGFMYLVTRSWHPDLPLRRIAVRYPMSLAAGRRARVLDGLLGSTRELTREAETRIRIQGSTPRSAKLSR
ncbi:hypothetical protein [Nocardia sp. NPDC004604]|uniref:hypothetical protein n=1 Tax=Nocardia sp. NPDC004604 TaxID=3157013 RepID=UPI0033B98DFD